MPITIVPSRVEYSHPYGDLMCEANDIMRKFELEKEGLEESTPLLLSYFDPNTWAAVFKIQALDQTALKQLFDICQYTCPYTRQVYTSLVPLVLWTNNPDQYFQGQEHAWYRDMACDGEWTRNQYSAVLEKGELTRIQKLLLGSGYTNGTLMSDGSNSVEQVVIDLSNGDKLVCAVWIWHNK